MNQIKCPNCKTEFTIDEANYADIVSQVKTAEFNKEINERITLLDSKNKQEIALQKSKLESDFTKQLSTKDGLITELKSKLSSVSNEQKLAIENATNRAESSLKDALNKKEVEMQTLKIQLSNFSKESELLLKAQESENEKKLLELSNQLQIAKTKNENELLAVKGQYDAIIKAKDEQVAYFKDFKAKQSTKLVGESLEQHCEIEFNKIRAAAFPNAYFEKDNDAKTGSKGDYIFKEVDRDDVEVISIMFEMKNQNETTTTKKKNSDFLKELDKDRREKGCEYAVLVSLLETDNELYNNGIVDVSHQYPKMFVVRPQFFLPIISLLRNAAMNSLDYKREVAFMKKQSIDVSTFEDDLQDLKDTLSLNYNRAGKKFSDAIKEINKSISALEKVKENLQLSEKNLRIAHEKADNVTVKKLTRSNKTMKAKFEAIEAKD